MYGIVKGLFAPLAKAAAVRHWVETPEEKRIEDERIRRAVEDQKRMEALYADGFYSLID